MNLLGCWFGHGNLIRTRNDQGDFALQCPECWQYVSVLQSPVIVGPKHQPEEVKGAPTEKNIKTTATKSKIYLVGKG